MHNLVYRIMAGELIITIDDITYKLINPDPRTKYEAECLYENTINSNRFDYFMTDSQCLGLLVTNEICSSHIDKNIKIISERIDELKVELFSFFVSHREDYIAKTKTMIDKVRNKQSEMLYQRHMFDHLTLKGYAEMIKQQFLIYSTLCYLDGTLVWKDTNDIDVDMLQNILINVNENSTSQKELRIVARNDPWRTFWNINKENPFDKAPIHLTEEQRILILFSKMYDNAYEHPECPLENVINDDDAFDGWMIGERKKREKDRITDSVNKKVGKNVGRADEIFIPVGSQREAKQIERMNDVSAKITKLQRQKIVQAKGQVNDSSFPDRKQQIQMQAVNQQVAASKGRK